MTTTGDSGDLQLAADTVVDLQPLVCLADPVPARNNQLRLLRKSHLTMSVVGRLPRVRLVDRLGECIANLKELVDDRDVPINPVNFRPISG